MSTWRVLFSYRNSYGTQRRAVAYPTATDEKAAVRLGRREIADLYGITGARFVSAQIAEGM